MADIFRGALSDRDGLPAAMTQLARQRLEPTSWETFVRRRPPARGGLIGSWGSTPSDPLAEVLVVRDEDYFETMTWLNAYFSGLAPITQWCRILPHSQAERFATRSCSIGLGHMLGAWVGAVLAECSVQAGGIQNLRDIAGSAAASSATFAAGRAAAVWGADNDFAEIARRHDELALSLREGSRPIAAEALVTLWSVLNEPFDRSTYSDRHALEPLISILATVVQQVNDIEPSELVARVALQASDWFKLPDLVDCADGPQVERVRALDRLSEHLSSGPRSPVMEAVLGLGASFIDPGAAVSPELLRRHGRQFPVAPIWQGVFAGALAPLRVMTDQGGLGRLVAKSLLASDDLQGRPSCDIAYDELIRWITPGRSLKLDVRGMSSRVLSVELAPGVTCVFSHGRTEPTASTAPRNELARTSIGERAKVGSSRTLYELDIVVTDLQQRIGRLEGRDASAQHSLDLPDPKDSRNRKGGRFFPPKGK
jgi:hypothetical protein